MKIFQRRAAEIEAEPAAFPQYTAKFGVGRKGARFLNALGLPGESLA
jgi:hypothetical protein